VADHLVLRGQRRTDLEDVRLAFDRQVAEQRVEEQGVMGVGALRRKLRVEGRGGLVERVDEYTAALLSVGERDQGGDCQRQNKREAPRRSGRLSVRPGAWWVHPHRSSCSRKQPGAAID